MPAAAAARSRTARESGRTLTGMPLFLLVLAFVVVPLTELSVIQMVSAELGLTLTLLLLVADSIAGAMLVRREGSRAWQQLRTALGEGRVPEGEMVGGVLLLFGGALLLTPGFVTDGVGLALVLPFTRAPIAALVRRRYSVGPIDLGGTPFEQTGGGVSADAATAGTGVEVLSVEREDRGADAAGAIDD
jgi:UPF0716 protein FxsA